MLDLQLVVAILVGLAGLWLGHSYRRTIRLNTADRLLSSYAALWELSGRFGVPEVEGGLTDAVRKQLAADLDAWYYEDGAGMLLSWRTRELLFIVVNNLRQDYTDLVPASLAASIRNRSPDEAQAQGACATRRHLSLLRTRLKADLAIYTSEQHLRRLRPDERELMQLCGIYRPWHAILLRLPLSTARTPQPSCACGFCGPAT